MGIQAGCTRALVWLRATGRHPKIAILLLVFLSLAGSVGTGLVRGTPLPFVHDEFSYLLAGETFAEGRLTNPTHPHWEHFETYHVIHVPSYQSKYPPGQGLALAVGKRVTGEPIVGVWLASAFMAAAIGWALLIWLPPSWAMLSALMCTAHLSWFSYWAQSYWGGALAAGAGALALGAFRVFTTDKPQWWHGGLLGIGLGILSVTRPFEGGILGLFLVAGLTLHWIRLRPLVVNTQVISALFVAGTILSVSFAGLGFYNAQITGAPLTMPYQVHEAQYGSAPSFLFQGPVEPPAYRHAEMERFWLDWVERRYQILSSPPALLRHAVDQTLSRAVELMGAGILGLLGLFSVFHGRDLSNAAHSKGMRLPLLIVLVVTSLSMTTAGAHLHYLAPITALAFLGVGKGLLGLHRRARARRELNIAGVIVLVFISLIAVSWTMVLSHPPAGFAQERHRLEGQLASLPAPQLVLVSYDGESNIFEEWVQNGPDIDAAPVVWARSMGPEADSELLRYFHGHSVWRLHVGQDVELTPHFMGQGRHTWIPNAWPSIP